MDTLVISAARNGDLSALKDAIRRGEDVNNEDWVIIYKLAGL